MPTSKRGNEIDLTAGGESYGHELSYNKDHTEEVDSIISMLDNQRANNDDNKVLDPILQAHQSYPVYATNDPLLAQEMNEIDEMGAITGDIVSSILKNPDGMTVEQLSEFVAIQEANKKYLPKEDLMMAEMEKNIEDQLNEQGIENPMAFLEGSIANDIAINSANINAMQNPVPQQQQYEAEVVETPEESFPGETVEVEASDTVSEIDTTEGIGEAIQMNDDMEPVKTATDDMSEMTEEEMENVPASTLDVDEESFLKSVATVAGEDISDDIALALLRLSNRYKNGEKFSVYDELPVQIKIQIDATCVELGNTTHSSKEFLAKNLINSIISEAYMSTEIDNFNDELKTYTDAIGNVPGVIVDSYSDEIKQKFEDNLLETADKIQEKNPEKAETLRNLAHHFRATYTFQYIYDAIDESGDAYFNRCYKRTRKINQFISEFNSAFENVEPKVKDLTSVALSFKMLGVSEEAAGMLMIMIGDSCLALPKGLERNVYSFYIITGIMNIAMSANTSDMIREIRSNVLKVAKGCDEFLHVRENDPKYGNNKKNKKDKKRRG